MFPRLWLPQLRGHILTQFARNTLLLVALPVLYLLLPQIVAIGHGYLRGSGYVPSEFEQRIFNDHWKIIALSALIAFGAAEIQGYLLRRAKAEPFINAPFQALIAELAQRARLPYTPAVIFIPQGPVTPPLHRAFFSAAKCLLWETSLSASMPVKSASSSLMRCRTWSTGTSGRCCSFAWAPGASPGRSGASSLPWSR